MPEPIVNRFSFVPNHWLARPDRVILCPSWTARSLWAWVCVCIYVRTCTVQLMMLRIHIFFHPSKGNSCFSRPVQPTLKLKTHMFRRRTNPQPPEPAPTPSTVTGEQVEPPASHPASITQRRPEVDILAFQQTGESSIERNLSYFRARAGIKGNRFWVRVVGCRSVTCDKSITPTRKGSTHVRIERKPFSWDSSRTIHNKPISWLITVWKGFRAGKALQWLLSCFLLGQNTWIDLVTNK